MQKLDAIAEYKIDTIKHLKRVHEEESDMNSLIFENFDGNRTEYIFNENIKYLDDDLRTRDKSNTLYHDFGKSKTAYGGMVKL